MAPTVTKNGNSLQVIIPREICKSTGISAGDELNVDSDGNTVVFSRSKQVRIYTIGYEGRTLENFISKLKSNGITQLIDVREIPASRKKGFSKKALCEELATTGIKYIHMPQLGSPSDIRHEYKNGGSELKFFRQYEEYVDESLVDQVKLLDEYMSAEPSAMMCFESMYIHCHRKILANKLIAMGHKVTHL